MKFRLTKIYTRTGDKGKTRLGDNREVAKDHPRVAAMGTVDELNSALGVMLAEKVPDAIHEMLTQVQHDLFDLGGELCMPGHRVIRGEHIKFLEEELDGLNEKLEPLKEFILPGGTRAAAACHQARTICRRAERCVITLTRKEEVSPESIRYLNRLSDLLFVMARSLNRAAGKPDVLWKHNKED